MKTKNKFKIKNHINIFYNFVKNNSMNSAIIFLSLMLIFFAIMLVIKIKIKFDLYENYLQIEIFLYGIKVLKIYISLIGLYYQINNSKKYVDIFWRKKMSSSPDTN